MRHGLFLILGLLGLVFSLSLIVCGFEVAPEIYRWLPRHKRLAGFLALFMISASLCGAVVSAMIVLTSALWRSAR